MKIYNIKYFIWGIIFLIPLPLFAFGSIKADWWQWLLSIGISVKYLSVGLSKLENERQERIEKNYQGVSQKLFGKICDNQNKLTLDYYRQFLCYNSIYKICI